MTPDLRCVGCHAAIHEALRRMPAPHLIQEHDVFDAFSDLTHDAFRFTTYRYSPPITRFAAERFIDEFEELIDPRGAWPDGAGVEDAFLHLHASKTEPEAA